MRDHVVLTGCTGLIGHYLLRDMLAEEIPLAVIVRSQHGESAAERVEAIMRLWERALGQRLPRPVCLEGDLREDRLGLDAAAQEWLSRHAHSMLHNAASVQFAERHGSTDVWKTNVVGTRHVLNCCEELKIPQFHYVSTAYVCGERLGTIYEEDFDCGQGFRNSYERSKFEAERLVRNAAHFDAVTIFRPAIVVGDSVTGYTRTYHHLYRYLNAVHSLSLRAARDPDGRWRVPIRITLTGEERKNFVPVDYVSRFIVQAISRAGLLGRTYHLAPEKPPTVRHVQEAMQKFFNAYGSAFVGKQRLSPENRTPLERFFYEYAASYADYWREEPLFDCRNAAAAFDDIQCPAVDVPCLLRLFDYAVRDQFGTRREPVLLDTTV